MIKNAQKVIIWQMIAIIGLNLAYVFVISDRFSYMGFTFTFNLSKLLVGTVILTIMLLLNYLIKDKFIFAVWNIMFIYLFAGEVIYYQYTKHSSIVQLGTIAMTLILLVFVSRTKKVFSENRRFKHIDQLLTPLSIILITPFIVLYYRYIDIKNLFLIDVYKTRALFRHISTPLTGYINAPLVRIILPFLIVENMERRKWFKVTLFFLMIIYIYLCGALKSVFMGLFALLLFYKGDYVLKVVNFLKAISFLTFFGILVEAISGSVFLLDSFIRRVFFVPPYLNNIYIKYFTGNYTYMSHSPLGLGLVESNLDRSLSMYVGEVVMGLKGLNANVGLFTEGYISFGFLGSIIFSMLICGIFLYIKMIKISPKYFGIVFVYIYYLNTSFLSTLLLTHGLFLFLVFSTLFLRHSASI
ncbi:O-antigen polymerase [Senegalia sp. (in: firmicutes)]|uniref:O-antigen polymerase n=1 Tax=Senegalia sp. (in: firmicutes) TaxID=1924098 RepID=UPI003F9C9F04